MRPGVGIDGDGRWTPAVPHARREASVRPRPDVSSAPRPARNRDRRREQTHRRQLLADRLPGRRGASNDRAGRHRADYSRGPAGLGRAAALRGRRQDGPRPSARADGPGPPGDRSDRLRRDAAAGPLLRRARRCLPRQADAGLDPGPGPGLALLVSLLRLPQPAGHQRGHRHRARALLRPLQRPPGRDEARPRPEDQDLPLEPGAAPRHLPDHVGRRRVRGDRRQPRRRAGAVLRAAGPGGGCKAGHGQHAEDDGAVQRAHWSSVSLGQVRPDHRGRLYLRRHGEHHRHHPHRQRVARRASQDRRVVGPAGRSRAGAPVVRRSADVQGLVPRVAQRGLRHLLRGSLHRAPPRPRRVPLRAVPQRPDLPE